MTLNGKSRLVIARFVCSVTVPRNVQTREDVDS